MYLSKEYLCGCQLKSISANYFNMAFFLAIFHLSHFVIYIYSTFFYFYDDTKQFCTRYLSQYGHTMQNNNTYRLIGLICVFAYCVRFYFTSPLLLGSYRGNTRIASILIVSRQCGIWWPMDRESIVDKRWCVSAVCLTCIRHPMSAPDSNYNVISIAL